jgi:hypothetical protein
MYTIRHRPLHNTWLLQLRGMETDQSMKKGPIALPLSLALFGAAFAQPSAQAQRRGFAPAAAGRGGAFAARGFRPAPMRGVGGYYGGYGYAPYLYSDYAPDYNSAPIITPADVDLTPPEPPAKPAEALIVELQGDHWVRITPYYQPAPAANQTTNAATTPSQALASKSSSAKSPVTGSQTPAPTSAAPLPRAVLVFRDGHQEEIGQYRIMGATIYLNTDYWTSGAWTRTVPIADLDVPATLKLNRQRGANFRLPSGPNEVMIGG